jgi:hypothetical protein
MSQVGIALVLIGGALLSFGIVALWFGLLGKWAGSPLPNDNGSPASGLRWLMKTSPQQLRYGGRGALTGFVVLLVGLLLLSNS